MIEREFEIKKQMDALERTKEIHEAEERLLKSQEASEHAPLATEQNNSEAAALQEEARIRGPLESSPEVLAERHLLQTEKAPESIAGRPNKAQPTTPERQELHKSPETIAEKQPGGPQRPSWGLRPDPTSNETGLAKGESPLEKHLNLAHVQQDLDDEIARWTAQSDSRIQARAPAERDFATLKGDAGEGRTYVDLLGRHDPERILHQPRFDDPDRTRTPDFAVVSAKNPDGLAEIVDSKAWSLVRPRDALGNPVDDERFFRHLLQKPEANSVLNMGELQEVVGKYAASPRLEPDGKVVLYFPEEVCRFTPQVSQQIEGWSGTEIAHGRVVEVRSMGVWQEELQKDVKQRLSM
jgi:hypothetical protein